MADIVAKIVAVKKEDLQRKFVDESGIGLQLSQYDKFSRALADPMAVRNTKYDEMKKIKDASAGVFAKEYNELKEKMIPHKQAKLLAQSFATASMQKEMAKLNLDHPENLDILATNITSNKQLYAMGIQPKKEGGKKVAKPRKKTAGKRKPRSDKGKKRGKKAK